MRIVVQRVSRAKLTVEGQVVSTINKGIVALVGLTDGDTDSTLPWMCNKLLNLRLWPDEKGKAWKESCVSQNLDVLLVSQFTLYAELNKGTKPDFHKAMAGEKAKELYAKFVSLVATQHKGNVRDGVFGAMMEVELVNDGPVTLTLNSPTAAIAQGKKAPKPVKAPKPPKQPRAPKELDSQAKKEIATTVLEETHNDKSPNTPVEVSTELESAQATGK